MNQLNISNKIANIESDIDELQKKVLLLEQSLGSKATQSQLKLSEDKLGLNVQSANNQIRNLERKLGKITLPENTRYYLEESEVQDFRANFQKLSALMIDVEKLYDNMIAYLANATTI